MADTDQSLYNLRYNQVDQGLEGFGGGTPQWTPLVLAVGTGAAGLNTQVQFNNSGVLGASPNLTFDGSILTVPAISVNAEIGLLLTSSSGIMFGVGANFINVFPPASVASYSLFLPSSQGGASTFLQNNGSGTLSWAAGGGGITQLTGDVTAGPGSGSQVASISSATVTSKLLTGYVSGAGTVAATDTILQGIDKLDGNATNISAVANAAVMRAGDTMTGVLTPPNSVNAALTGTVTPVTNVNNYFYTVTGNTTLNGPASPTADGEKVTFRILNDATHSVTLATGAGNFRFGTDIPNYTNSVSLTDYIGAIWNNADSRWDVVSMIQGF